MLTIYKASAGSGKTFQLVAEYIQLLLLNPDNYRHILAVTFTNKATNEMKNRILNQLHLLSGNHPSAYLKVLLENENFTEEIVRKRARQVLKKILHDYNRFSISTIDAFTQRIIKSFNRELGISPDFTLELDTEMILAEATDHLLEKTTTDKKLLKWLMDYSREQIEDNNSQHIERNIKSLGSELFKEKFQVVMVGENEKKFNREHLGELAKSLQKIRYSYESTLKNMGRQAMKIIADAGLYIDDFSRKSSGIAGLLEKYANGNQTGVTATALAAIESPKKWYTQTSPKRFEIEKIATNKLIPLLQKIVVFIEENECRYLTALVLRKQWRTLGILTDLKEEIVKLLREKNILQISDANLILSKIIGQSDSPFIYEKTGSYFHHFMLDEFQDTSDLQWNNFKPLIFNALASGKKSLLVGDVKQSVYRWRNSNWQILAEGIKNDFRTDQLDVKFLQHNFRSDKNIIDFNNRFFQSLKSVFQNYQFKTQENSDELKSLFNRVYDSIEQVPGKKNTGNNGFVNINFLPKNDFSIASSHQLIKQVKYLQDNGIKASETAILTRTNKEGKAIVEHFMKAAAEVENMKYNLSVLSNESLFLHASQGVMFVIYALKHIINPENEVIKMALLNLWSNWLQPALNNSGATIKEQHNTPAFGLESNGEKGLTNKSGQLFELMLAPIFKEAGDIILLSSLDEMVMRLAKIFGLLKIKTELPYLQTLADKASELKFSLHNDISNFLFWWEEQGMNTSVTINEDADSIRLLTVHKAKGLEFKAVIIPFFDWKTSVSGNFAPILWCTTDIEPFNSFPLLPVKATSILEKTVFKNDYYNEVVNRYVDVFNLAYVAFTRAKSVLIVNCPEAEEPARNTGSAKPMNYLLRKVLDEMSASDHFSACFNNEKTVFEYGKMSAFKTLTEKQDSVLIESYSSFGFHNRVKLRKRKDDFPMPATTARSQRDQGNILHEILSQVITLNDTENAVADAVAAGLITEKESPSIIVQLNKILGNKEVRHWFNGTYKVLNERNLLKKEVLVRPDRIMVSGENAIVVDYKTGELTPGKYEKQVQKYAQLLQEAGYKNVEGYLWFTQLQKVQKVYSSGQNSFLLSK
ncbi:MAG: hypothetical protein CR996_00980 [Draconibacterium sp.]|nr:MAG: hypothetical protein CR996_00980 [Draconibacterium sp.]PIF06544.1 MAG: hypothetical protein CSA36_00865 [Draconibacterium sp.]